MNKKQVIRINESQLRQIVTESVKRVLNEENDEFTPHGYMTKSNFGGTEVQISNDGSAARFRNNYGTPDKPTDWLEIEFDEEGVAYVTLPNGSQERLDNYMRY